MNEKAFPQALSVTFKRPFYMVRTDDEVWPFIPPYHYVFMSDHLEVAKDYVDSASTLDSVSHFRPLMAGRNLVNKSVYIERHRDRGVGDLLFMTGPISYLQHMTNNSVRCYLYALSERGQVLFNHPALTGRTPYFGPVTVESLRAFDYHWVIPTVTESSEESEQKNVYDALYEKIGIDPETVDVKFKRPSVCLDSADHSNLDSLFFFIYNEYHLDFRKMPYYVVAPFCYSNLRSLPYSTWLKLIAELSDQRPVVVIGQVKDRMPVTDMPAYQFIEKLNEIRGNNPVINLVSQSTPLRLVMSVIEHARCLFCLDSGPLYIAQALRTPAVSLWGNANPAIRIGYDEDYMKLAVWESNACSCSPCYAYDRFPSGKCPRQDSQRICEVLSNTTPNKVLEKLEDIERANPVRLTL